VDENQQFKFAANRAWYLMWGSPTLPSMPIINIATTSDMASTLAKYMQQEMANHIIQNTESYIIKHKVFPLCLNDAVT
jgi:hypothetical protein